MIHRCASVYDDALVRADELSAGAADGFLFIELVRVFALDLRNHGRSPHTDEFNYAVMRDDVRESMEQQRIKPACLLGHSIAARWPCTWLSLIQTSSRGSSSWTSRRARIGSSAVGAARTFGGPALLVRGGYASYVLDDDRDLIARMFPHYQLVTIPHAGHWGHADAPEEFVAVVRDFLSA